MGRRFGKPKAPGAKKPAPKKKDVVPLTTAEKAAVLHAIAQLDGKATQKKVRRAAESILGAPEGRLMRRRPPSKKGGSDEVEDADADSCECPAAPSSIHQADARGGIWGFFCCLVDGVSMAGVDSPRSLLSNTNTCPPAAVTTLVSWAWTPRITRGNIDRQCAVVFSLVLPTYAKRFRSRSAAWPAHSGLDVKRCIIGTRGGANRPPLSAEERARANPSSA